MSVPTGWHRARSKRPAGNAQRAVAEPWLYAWWCAGCGSGFGSQPCWEAISLPSPSILYYVSSPPHDPNRGRKDAATSLQIPPIILPTANAEITFSPDVWVWIGGCFEYRSAGMQTWQKKTSCRPQFQNLQSQSLGMELGRPDCFSTPLRWLCLALIGFLEITTWQRTGHKQPGWGTASKSRCDRRVALLMAPLPGKAQRRQEVRDPTLTPRLAENSHIPW